jgi:hypothetical protein
MLNPARARKHPRWAAWRRDCNHILLKLACYVDDGGELAATEKQSTENLNFLIPSTQLGVELQGVDRFHVMLPVS